MTVLHLELIEDNLFVLDFSISKTLVSRVKRSQEGEFFLHGYEIFFSRFSLLSIYQTLLKVSDPVFEKNPT